MHLEANRSEAAPRIVRGLKLDQTTMIKIMAIFIRICRLKIIDKNEQNIENGYERDHCFLIHISIYFVFDRYARIT